jgi:thioredoxin 1
MKKTSTIFTVLFGVLMSFGQTALSDKDVEAKLLINNDRLIVLDFYATWCGPCKKMEPIIKELEQQYGSQVDFYKIDVDNSQVDDALGIRAMPTYLFLKNSENLEQIEGAMSKASMEGMIKKHLNTNSTANIASNSSADNFDLDDFSQTNIDKIWDSSPKLNSLAWNAYQRYNDINILLKAIKVVERSIVLDKNYYNVDTHAALLYKTGNYNKALKRAKEAVDIAKADGQEYTSTSQLIEKIIDDM